MKKLLMTVVLHAFLSFSLGNEVQASQQMCSEHEFKQLVQQAKMLI
jgi:hypothetical protein